MDGTGEQRYMAAFMIRCERDEDEDEQKSPMFVDDGQTIPSGGV